MRLANSEHRMIPTKPPPERLGTSLDDVTLAASFSSDRDRIMRIQQKAPRRDSRYIGNFCTNYRLDVHFDSEDSQSIKTDMKLMD